MRKNTTWFYTVLQYVRLFYLYLFHNIMLDDLLGFFLYEQHWNITKHNIIK